MLVNVSAGPFLCDYRIHSYMIRFECWACLSNMVLDVFLSWSNVSVGRAILTSRLDISTEEDLHDGYPYNQHEKGLAL